MNIFEEILLDDTSGSGTILEKVQDRLIEISTAEELVDTAELILSLNSLVYQFPQFGLIHHFYHYLVDSFNAASGTSIKGTALSVLVEEYLERWEGVQTSASKQLLDYGFEVHLFHEDSLNRYLKELDMAILGADLILEDRFLNKSGSFPIALMFEHAGLPVYLLADERKLFQEDDISTDILRIIEDETNKPLSDFGIALDEKLITHNHYFEFTPLSMVNQLFLGEETK